MTETLVVNVILQKIAVIMIRSRPGRRQKNIKPDTQGVGEDVSIPQGLSYVCFQKGVQVPLLMCARRHE